jgi:hypothetical protein
MAQGVGPEFKPQYTHTHTHTHTHTKIWKGKEELFLAGVMDVLTLDYGDGCWYPHISKHITMDSLNVHGSETHHPRVIQPSVNIGLCRGEGIRKGG